MHQVLTERGRIRSPLTLLSSGSMTLHCIVHILILTQARCSRKRDVLNIHDSLGLASDSRELAVRLGVASCHSASHTVRLGKLNRITRLSLQVASHVTMEYVPPLLLITSGRLLGQSKQLSSRQYHPRPAPEVY
jgi:hypothetical protein